MLNLPAAVQTLFRTDGVRKNFRAHFPKGELPDIVNDQIVKESVQFTESICSQDSLKFGLTEASMIEFETVGVGNMRGMRISCSTEIDVSSLSSAQISDIEAGSWDGELVQPSASGLSFPVFRVPYGVFRVDSCPRNQQAMAHRRVKAYSVGAGSLSENPFETEKLALLTPGGNTYDPQAKALLCAAVGYTSPQFMANAGYERSNLYWMSDESSRSRQGTLTMTDGTTKDFNFVFRMKYTLRSDANPSALYSADLHGYNFRSAVSAFAAWLTDYGVDAERSGYDDMESLVKAFLPWAPAVVYDYSSGGNITVGIAAAYFSESNEAILPYRPGLKFSFEVPLSLSISTTRAGGGGIDSITRNPVAADIYGWTATSSPSSLDSVAISIPSTLQQTRSIGGVSRTCWSFTNAFSLLDYANGFLELSAAFGRADRSGNIAVDRLSNSPVVSIGPGDMSELWWDESSVAPIGAVVFSYKDTNGNDQTATCVIGSGAGTYDMTRNAFLKLLTNASASQIETLITENFGPYVTGISYTPVQLDIRSFPWIEAADALQLTAEDGTVVSTYAMRHEISGIQSLFAEIDSSGNTE